MTPGERNCWRSLDQKELRNPNLLKQFKDIKSSKKKKKYSWLHLKDNLAEGR